MFKKTDDLAREGVPKMRLFNRLESFLDILGFCWSLLNAYLSVSQLTSSQNMGSLPSLPFLLPLLITFLLLTHLSSAGKTGLLVAGGEGAMRSAEVAAPLNVVLSYSR